MARYAASTDVSTEQSLTEIMRIVRRYGADGFGSGWDEHEGQHVAWVQFRAEGRFVRFILPMPDRGAREFTHSPERQVLRSQEAARKAWEQGCRQRWRALALAIKAKLEAVEAQITTFEREFLAHIVLPDGSTVADRVGPAIAQAYLTGDMPRLLPEWSGAEDVIDAEEVS